MLSRRLVQIRRHIRFYIGLSCGLAGALAARLLHLPASWLIGGDVFYLVFLGLMLTMTGGIPAPELKRRARRADEGIWVVIMIIIATMLFFFAAVFEALSRKHGIQWPALVLAGVGAPLGWFALHTAMAFHYADLHYFDDPDCADDAGDLDFPGRSEPGPWDFLYFSFVVGMTCQVSDVQVKTAVMRRAVLWHGLVSFFFNTVFIAMTVNAAVAMAS